jgi:hypothetical protein
VYTVLCIYICLYIIACVYSPLYIYLPLSCTHPNRNVCRQRCIVYIQYANTIYMYSPLWCAQTQAESLLHKAARVAGLVSDQATAAKDNLADSAASTAERGSAAAGWTPHRHQPLPLAPPLIVITSPPLSPHTTYAAASSTHSRTPPTPPPFSRPMPASPLLAWHTGTLSPPPLLSLAPCQSQAHLLRYSLRSTPISESILCYKSYI